MRPIKNGDLPAAPLANGADGTPWLARDLGNPEQVIGFTKREQMRVTFMAAIVTGNPQLHPKGVANIANELADEALATIERWQQ